LSQGEWVRALANLRRRGIINDEEFSNYKDYKYSKNGIERLKFMKSLFQRKKYDGYTYINNVEDAGSVSWAVFDSNQIKSAGGENTTFLKDNDNIYFFKDSKGVVYGYVDNHGNIHFDKNKISPQHPIHEYTHIWDRVVAVKNPSLWIRGVELMK